MNFNLRKSQATTPSASAMLDRGRHRAGSGRAAPRPSDEHEEVVGDLAKLDAEPPRER
jgi:hypothetical protein